MQLTKITKEQFDEGVDRLRVRKPETWTKRKRAVGTLMVDGEGPTDNGFHRYSYLAAADPTGEIIHETRKAEEGLTTDECFWFLVTLPKTYRKVAFSFNYDVNMMIGDIPLRYLQMLQEKKFVRWNGWRINWVQHKNFSVSRRAKNGETLKCMVWDIFGYFQKSFVETIWEWKVGSEEELRFVAEMKAQRSQFEFKEIDQIAEYCRLECKLGSQVFEKVVDNTKSLGLNLRRYDGAGSVAAAMLRKHSVQAYMHQTSNRIPDVVIKSGYYGGRFDLSTYGECGDAIEYDIKSAYPAQALNLPCLACGEWEYATDYSKHEPWAVWHVTWDIAASNLWSPFPYRHGKGIYWLRNGSGWYWQNEVREAIALYGDAIKVHQGYVYHTGCNHQPFEFISEYYNKRQKLAAAGDLAQLILKLGLNSLYGKLAQGVGHKHKPPATQCLIWAGIITSNTRAMLLSQIRSAPDDALLLATDAVIRKSEAVGFTYGNGLGEWSPQYLQRLFIICNGFYQAGHSGEIKKTRSFNPADMYSDDGKINHWKRIRELASKSDKFKYHIPTRDFVTLGAALTHNPPLDHWRTWHESTKCINYGGHFKYKEMRDGRLYPINNPWGLAPSDPFEPDLYRLDDAPLLDAMLDVDAQDEGIVQSEGEAEARQVGAERESA